MIGFLRGRIHGVSGPGRAFLAVATVAAVAVAGGAAYAAATPGAAAPAAQPASTSGAKCTPDLTTAPGLADGVHAFLIVGEDQYAVSKFVVGGVGCPVPPTLISVANTSQDLGAL